MFLTRAEADAIDARTAGVEARTGAQVVTAVIGKADSYVELPWKAFALGAALAAFALVLADAARPDWVTAHTALLHAVAILGAGAASALVCVFAPPFARLFLRPTRRDLEVRQYAQSLFLTRELFRTRGRTGILVLVSLFERKVEILPDVGLHERVGASDWDRVIGSMAPLLRAGRPAEALQAGLAAIEELLAARGFRPSAGGADELPDRPIEERGP
jgi:putative membrane protein